jgi:hypothetical protein
MDWCLVFYQWFGFTPFQRLNPLFLPFPNDCLQNNIVALKYANQKVLIKGLLTRNESLL